MAKKIIWLGMLATALVFGMVLVGCPTETEPEETDTWTWKESLRKYMGPSPQTWSTNGVQDEKDTYVYYVNPDHFAAFKDELDAGGEYSQEGEEWTYTRDWDLRKSYVRWAERPDDKFELNLCKSDNSVIGYSYTKIPTAQRQKLDASLRKYMGPNPQTWSTDGVSDAKDTYVYYVAPDHFAAFKAELDEWWVEYYQGDNGTEQRNWDQGKTFVRWAERPDGIFELGLAKSDNSYTWYRYKKVPQVNASWAEQWDEGTITLTYLGLNKPSDFVLNDTHDGRGEYKGYYRFSYQTGQGDGGTHRTRYVYYPTSGRKDVQFSNWLD
jgi:hypothetical protein